jgi:hypothetical protein
MFYIRTKSKWRKPKGHHLCRNLSLGLVTKAKACKGAGQEECGRVWEWRLTLPSELPFWELESWWTLELSESNCASQNTSHWKVSYIIGKLLKCKCLKWACMTHLDICNTSYGKRKAGSQTGKLPTTKCWESTRPPCVQVACDTPLESSWWELQLCFRPRPNRRSEHEVIAPQSSGSYNLGSFGTPLWESRDKKPFGCSRRGEVQSILYGGRWCLPPRPGRGESYESEVARGLS